MARASQRSLTDAVEFSAIAVCGLFIIHALRRVLEISAVPFGVVPRTSQGLVGVVCSPLFHASWNHLFANALPLFVLLIILLADRKYHPWKSLFIIWTVSGLGTWLIGRGNSVHIGASGIIFGLAAYLIVAGLLMKSWRAVLVAVIVLVLFGGMFYGVLPRHGPISWEAHLCGALAGALTAKWNHV